MGFVLGRPKKRLVKADEVKREAFVADYAVLWDGARRLGARYSSLTRRTSGRTPSCAASGCCREKAGYYPAVCLEMGEVEWMELEGNSNAGTSVAFLMQLCQRQAGPLKVVWDNAPVYRGEAVREYLRTPGLGLRLVNPRFRGGRFCRATARTSTPRGYLGLGEGEPPPFSWERPPAICAWAPKPQCKQGSAISSPVWPTGKPR